MSIVAKMKCESVKKDQYGNEHLHLYPVTDDCPENKAWSTATPGGAVDLMISNPLAQGHFAPGDIVRVTLEKFLLVFLLLSTLLALLAPSLALAQAVPTSAPAAPGLLEQFLTPGGIATVVGTLASLLFGVWKVGDVRKKQLALGTYHAFHAVEDLAATTENTVDDKVAAGLKALDGYFRAHGWRPLKPGEEALVKAGFSELHGAQKAAEKVQEVAVQRALEAFSGLKSPQG